MGILAAFRLLNVVGEATKLVVLLVIQTGGAPRFRMRQNRLTPMTQGADVGH